MSEQTKQLRDLSFAELQAAFYNVSMQIVNNQSAQHQIIQEMNTRATEDKNPQPPGPTVHLPKLQKINLPNQ
jgi:hypothetical protein